MIPPCAASCRAAARAAVTGMPQLWPGPFKLTTGTGTATPLRVRLAGPGHGPGPRHGHESLSSACKSVTQTSQPECLSRPAGGPPVARVELELLLCQAARESAESQAQSGPGNPGPGRPLGQPQSAPGFGPGVLSESRVKFFRVTMPVTCQ